MNNAISHLAHVSADAKIGDNVTIDAFAVVDSDVEIGANTHVMNHAVLLNGSRIGNDCIIYPHATIGAAPQDLKYHGQHTTAVIGNRTTIRECVTVNKGSHTESTTVGSDCLIMAYTHIAHDCVIGDNVILANTVQLGGHVKIGDWAILGGVAKVHQFCRVGEHSMIAADAMLTKDAAPFALIGRDPVKTEGINKIGLIRRGFSKNVVIEIEIFFTTVFFSGFNMSDGIAQYLKSSGEPIAEIQFVIGFIRESQRGVYR